MKENLALLLAVLYLIYRFKTYRKTNKIIEDRIENVHKPYFKRVRDVLGCSEEEAEKVKQFFKNLELPDILYP